MANPLLPVRPFWRSLLLVAGCLSILPLTNGILAADSKPVNPLLKEYTITIDPTTLQPPTRWHIPGITPLIWTGDPASSPAFQTTEVRQVKLKPGEYRFGTFTFDFTFRVTLSGTLDYPSTLDQCVSGRGTQRLTIRCSHTQPYPQEPDYSYDSLNGVQ
ncbi:MAG: hypothetical protein D6690_14440 [Nitrospirae bacterium]|nr:MAG: hypothetical protein D6690_14440 [Nitrospirota bacterium]